MTERSVKVIAPLADIPDGLPCLSGSVGCDEAIASTILESSADRTLRIREVSIRMAESRDPELDLLAVGAHPDDVEIACGGTLASLARKGYAVGIVDLTDGEPTPHSPGPEVRLAEAERAAQILGVSIRLNLNLPNRRLFDSFETRIALAKVFRRLKPKVVLGFGGKTVLASPDHYQAMLITDAAVFYSRLTKWDEFFDGLPTHTIGNQLSFPIALHGLDLPEASGYIVADIGSTLEVKLEAIRAYQTQFPASKAGIFRAVEAMNRYQGLTAGFEAGEVFMTYRSVGVDDLMRWASPAHARPMSVSIFARSHRREGSDVDHRQVDPLDWRS